jgi:CheY-like chemotaxis protein
MARVGGQLMKVLLVEDCRDCADSTAVLLRTWGHEVEAVRDGPAALRAVRQRPPDVVLLDIALPGGMDGWETARRIRGADEKRPLLVASTGYEQDSDRHRSEEAGIDLHLLKPIGPGELKGILDTWQSVIDGSGSQRNVNHEDIDLQHP